MDQQSIWKSLRPFNTHNEPLLPLDGVMDVHGKCDSLCNTLFPSQTENHPPLPPNSIKYHTTSAPHYTPMTLAEVNNMI
jgi:hypothetical protein